jgi:regulator of sirC expression with transglutaminase-like and TPR domain
MDITQWSGRAAIEAWLGAQAQRPDAALDLAGMALALAAIARPDADVFPYAAHLDALAEEAGALAYIGGRGGDPVAVLNAVLFERNGYRGDAETYDDLDNADLMRVIDRRKGLPIALSILYMHMARALGWPADGVNFPGHFLVRIGAGAEARLVDPFAAGTLRTPDDLQRLLRRYGGSDARLGPEHLAAATNRQVLLRLQNNIKTRCAQKGDAAGALAAVETMTLVAPGQPGLWYEAALFAAELGQLQRARASLETVSRLDADGGLAPQVKALLERLRARLN